MAVRYLTEAWGEGALRVLEDDEGLRKALRGHEFSMLVIIIDVPDGCYGYIYAAFDSDGLCDYRVGHDYNTVADGLGKPKIVVSGDYDTFVDIHHGKLTEAAAVIKGKLHINGPIVRVVRYRNVMAALTAALRRLDLEF